MSFLIFFLSSLFSVVPGAYLSSYLKKTVFIKILLLKRKRKALNHNLMMYLTTIAKEKIHSGTNCLLRFGPKLQTFHCVPSHCVNFDKIIV